MRHPNGTNFRRVARLDIVDRVRKLHETKLMKERPRWLEWCERVPPMENHNLKLQSQRIRNPYPSMVSFLLKKYPDLRFQDAYVDGNDWSKGNDAYRNDHPVMQFVSRQLEFMNEGLSKPAAFEATESLFRKRRMQQEAEQKVLMAMALDSGFSPMFTTGGAFLEAEKAKAEIEHLKIIRGRLRDMTEVKLAELEAANADGEADRPVGRIGLGQKKKFERELLSDAEKDRMGLVGSHVLEHMATSAEPEQGAQQQGQESVPMVEDELRPIPKDNLDDDSALETAQALAAPDDREQEQPMDSKPVPGAGVFKRRADVAPDLTPAKPESTISIVARRPATGGSRKSQQELARMLRGSDMDDDEWDLDREQRRKSRNMDFDEDYDDVDPLDDLLGNDRKKKR